LENISGQNIPHHKEITSSRQLSSDYVSLSPLSPITRQYVVVVAGGGYKKFHDGGYEIFGNIREYS